MSLGRVFSLSSGTKIPAVGLGTWQSAPNEVTNAVEVALKTGYRHIDGAWIYGNEKEVGEGIRKSGVNRDEIFLTTKLWNTSHKHDAVLSAMDVSLQNLEVKYVDLYLIHWPFNFKESKENVPKNADGTIAIDESINIKDTWSAMEKLVEQGKTKSIGVSNFNVPRLQELLKIAKIKPAVNQVELHPYNPQWELLDFCKENGIHVTAYSPLGSSDAPLSKEPVIVEIAKKYNKNPTQVLISWGAQRGTSVIPKSVHDDRIKSNFEDFVLEDADFQKINELSRDTTKRRRFCDPKTFWNGLACFEDDKQ